MDPSTGSGQALSITVPHAIDADAVVAALDRLISERGRPPAFVRFDHGPEVIATVVADWCRWHRTETMPIDPGSPWQNAWIKSFNSRLRDELLNLWHFDSLLKAAVLIEDWRIDYNTNRPHSAPRRPHPTEFTQAWTHQHQPKPIAAGPSIGALAHLLRPLAMQRPRSTPLDDPRRAPHRHRHLDRTHLPPPPPTARPRTIDPHRVRDHHDLTDSNRCLNNPCPISASAVPCNQISRRPGSCCQNDQQSNMLNLRRLGV